LKEKSRKGGAMKPKHQTPLKAILDKCKNECCCGDFKSWKFCNIERCPLLPLRFGKNPYHNSTLDKSKKLTKENPIDSTKKGHPEPNHSPIELEAKPIKEDKQVTL